MTLYDSEIACPMCKTEMTVELWGTEEINIVKKKGASIRELRLYLRGVWGKLSTLEKKSLEEVFISFHYNAYTASEIMTLRKI